jgi:hypothetical protein
MDIYRRHRDGIKLVSVTNLTDACLEMAAKDADGKKPSTRKKKPEPKQYYRLESVDGATVYLDDDDDFSLDNPDVYGNYAKDEYTLIVEKDRRSEWITEAEAALGIKCNWVEVYFVFDAHSADRWLKVEDLSDSDASEEKRSRSSEAGRRWAHRTGDCQTGSH